MFTTDNTEGYTTEQLAALNAELAAKLDEVKAENGVDYDRQCEAIEKAFADEVAAR